jgi:hypothetical protein
MRTLLLVLLLFQLYLKEGLQPIQLSYDVGENWEDSLGGPPCFVNMYNHKVLGETLITMKKKYLWCLIYVPGDGIEQIQAIDT